MPAIPTPYLIAGGALLLVVGYIYFRGVKGAAADVAGAAVNAAAGTVEGATIAAGSIVGIPQTDQTQCEAACAAGDGWSASKYCTAGRYLSYLLNGK